MRPITVARQAGDLVELELDRQFGQAAITGTPLTLGSEGDPTANAEGALATQFAKISVEMDFLSAATSKMRFDALHRDEGVRSPDGSVGENDGP